MTVATAVLFDGKDALAFTASRPGDAIALALTPDAAAEFADPGLSFVAANEIYLPENHRRALDRVAAAKTALAPAFDDLPPAARETVRGLFELTAHMSARVHETLKEGPWLFRDGVDWRPVDAQPDAELALLRRLARVPWWRAAPPQKHRAVTRLLNNIAAKTMAPKNPVIFTNFDRGFGPLHDAFLKADKSGGAVSFLPAAGGIRDAALAGRAVLQSLGGGRAVQMPCIARGGQEGLAEKIGEFLLRVDDPVIERGLTVFGEIIIADAVAADGMARYLSRLFPRLQPRAVMSYSLRWRIDAALGEAAGNAGIPRWLASHGSHGKAVDETYAAAADDHARGLLVSPLADRVFVQSPHAEAAARRLAPTQETVPAKPFVWGFQRARRVAARSGPFHILQAGTPKAWRDHRPWMYETTDEYVAGIIALIGAVERLNGGAKLTVRVRKQPECGLAALEKLLPQNPHVTVKSGGSFLDDLATADLLVSHSSTTIEEALAASVPVLLWGGGCPYRHLPARTTIPSDEDRAAIYSIDDDTDAQEMLSAIIAAHEDKPLTAEELSDHIWPDDVPGAEQIAARLSELRYRGN